MNCINTGILKSIYTRVKIMIVMEAFTFIRELDLQFEILLDLKMWKEERAQLKMTGIMGQPSSMTSRIVSTFLHTLPDPSL